VVVHYSYSPGTRCNCTDFSPERQGGDEIIQEFAGILLLFFLLEEGKRYYRMLVAGLLAFTLFNSSDAFLLLAIKNQGLSDEAMIGIYIFYNLIYALLAFPIGILADKFGLHRTLVAGLLLFAIVYTCMGFAMALWQFLAVFAGYAIYAAATEACQKP
jgi:MFS family permease